MTITINGSTGITNASGGTVLDTVNLAPLGLNASGSAPVFACRAWVNFNGSTNPPTIRASGNVSSVTRTSIGLYVVNFTVSLPDANYAAVYGGHQFVNGGDTTRSIVSPFLSTASSHTLQTGSGASSGRFDFEVVSVSIFG